MNGCVGLGRVHACRSPQQGHKHISGQEGFVVLLMGEIGSKRAQNRLIPIGCASQMARDRIWKHAFSIPF